MGTVIKAIVAVVLLVVGIVLGLLGLLATVASVLLRAAPIILAVLLCVWILSGCTTNVTIDNSVIDQSDVTQVLGCATDYGLMDEA